MLMASLSLMCSLLVFLTSWAVLPIFVFIPLAIWCGWRSYRQAAARHPAPGMGRRLLALVPLGVAIATIPLVVLFFQHGYRA